MALSNVRIGNPTSSEIVDLTKFGTAKGSLGATFFSYVEDCRAERFFKMRLEEETSTFPMDWGKLVENFVHQLLPMDYKFQSDDTKQHPKFAGWYGTPDGTKWIEKLRKLTKTRITDIKCPTTKKAFYTLIAELYNFDGVTVTPKPEKEINFESVIATIRKKARDGEKFYWQCVSNACIEDVNEAELIVFMPYFEQLEEIKLLNTTLPDGGYSTVAFRKIEELPFILKETGVNNVNVIPFKIPVADKQFLEMRVRMAMELINMDKKDYDAFISLGVKDEKLVLDYINKETGENILHVTKAA